MPIFPRYSGPPLIDQICSVENLTQAWRRVRRNIQTHRRAHSAGVDEVTIRDFEHDWARQMAQLADDVRHGAYRPLPPRRVMIPKRSGGERAIAILTIRDRVMQRATQQVLEPLFDPLFLDCSYGCRPLVGVPEAIARVVRYADQGLDWVAEADISAYFDSIDQRIVLSLVRQRIDEPAVLRLIAQWLSVGMLQNDGDALDDPPPETPLQRGGRMLRETLTGAFPPPPEQPGFTSDPADSYAAAAWEQAAPSGWGGRSIGMEPNLWTAVSLARPLIDGARAALPVLKRIGTQRLLIAGAVAAGAVAVGELAARALAESPRGTPQGGALSPLLANIYLHPFDLALTSQGYRLVRFMDDFVLMCADQPEAERALDVARRQAQALRLTLKPEKTRVIPYDDGLAFLGEALAPRARGPRLEDGLQSFTEAEQALRNAAGNARRQIEQRFTRKP